MGVYVDEVRLAAPYGRNDKWPYKYFCHMVADSLDELFAMADQLSLDPKWFQHNERPWLAHYDLVKSKRADAIRLGAVEITAREWIKRHITPADTGA